MARPFGTPSHWWKTRKQVSVWLYNPTEDDIKQIRKTAQDINAARRAQSTGV